MCSTRRWDIRHYDAWSGLQTIVRVQREVRVQGNATFETAYYISSLPHVSARAWTLRSCLNFSPEFDAITLIHYPDNLTAQDFFYILIVKGLTTRCDGEKCQ
jgi:hypothetical protein